MTPLEEKAGSLSRDEIVALLMSEQKLTVRIGELERQLEWFQRQVFGSKSERRILSGDGRQLGLGEQLDATTPAAAVTDETVRSYVRRRRKDPLEGASDDNGLRFDPSVPVREIQIPNPEIADLPPESYTVVGKKETCRLAQEPGAYVVLRYVREVVKLKKEGTFSCPPAPPSVLEKSFADVSLLAGILLDKFLFYLPLYRQHQRLAASGIHLGRSTLTQWVHAVIALLEPIYLAQWESVLSSSVLVMDETPVKAGRVQPRGRSPGKMKTGFFWPILGDHDEVLFPFSPTRAHAVVEQLLGEFRGTLLSDGYEAYSRFAAKVEGLVHALCWSHYLELAIIQSLHHQASILAVLQPFGSTTTPDKSQPSKRPGSSVSWSCAVGFPHYPRGTTTRGLCLRFGGKATSARALEPLTFPGSVDSAPTAERMLSAKARN